MEVLQFKDQKMTPDIVHTYSSNLRNNSVAIVIDNGSYSCRVGWATDKEPLLQYKNLIAKPRKERYKKDGVEIHQTPQLQVGNDIINIETVRLQLKTQFDRNVVTHFEAQEHLFDYMFTHLGIDTENSVKHPIVITEAFLNPNSSRQLMSELLFECYGVDSVAYGVDSLFSYHFSNPNYLDNGIIINVGYYTIHIIPILDKQTIYENTRRINIGGFNVASFLHRILQLKYPAHTTSITISRAEELLHHVCKVALHYKDELQKWTDVDYYEQNIKRIQLPYTTSLVSSTLTLEQQKERKRELARRLTEINARKREERLAEDEEKLIQLLNVQELIEVETDSEEVDKALSEYHLKNVTELQKTITNLNTRIERTKQKIVSANSNEEVVVDEPSNKQGKYNKMVFEDEKAMLIYLQNAKRMKQEILNKKTIRKQRKQDMAKRRTAAGQERMRIISQLARKEKGNDDFGLRDEDWDIYKAISRDGGDSDSEAENEKLIELEEVIKTHEPNDISETSTPGETYQLHIGVEMYRAPELIFKPYMCGSPEAGLTEVLEYVLSLFDSDSQAKLAANVILTGGLSNLNGLKERVQSELISMRPFQSYSNVSVLPRPSLTAWLGAREWANKPEMKDSFFTKGNYEEFGSEYFKTHIASNLYSPSPKGHTIDTEMQ